MNLLPFGGIHTYLRLTSIKFYGLEKYFIKNTKLISENRNLKTYEVEWFENYPDSTQKLEFTINTDSKLLDSYKLTEGEFTTTTVKFIY